MPIMHWPEYADPQVARICRSLTPDPKPQDAMALPLLVNGRVVGAITLAGLLPRQFDQRLFIPLRRVTSLVANFMYHNNQLWQMRRLNWLATHYPLQLWKQHDEQNQFNPLKPVAGCLANIFLCPVVHVWLRRHDDPERFVLHGYSWSGVFVSADKQELRDAPFLVREMVGGGRRPRPGR